MPPEINIHYPAVLAAMAANIVIGFVWYGPLFGKVWAREAGLPADFKPDPKLFARAMGLMVVGAFLTSYVLAHEVRVWRPSVWGAGTDSPDAVYGFFAAFFVWLGFYLPVLSGAVAWENKSWKLFLINAAFYFVALQAAGMILSFWR
ncbi:MAG: DUF1761 domain-containing protein [Elusimicrobiota bacterium]